MIRTSLISLLIVHATIANVSASDACGAAIKTYTRSVDDLQALVTGYTNCANLMPVAAERCYQQFERLRDAQRRTLEAQYAFIDTCKVVHSR